MNDTCSICLNPVRKTRSVTELKCEHMFHKECLKKWDKDTCPMCRDNYGPDKYKVTLSIENLRMGRNTSMELPNSIIETLISRMNINPTDIENYSTDITFDFDNLEQLEQVLTDLGVRFADIDSSVFNTE